MPHGLTIVSDEVSGAMMVIVAGCGRLGAGLAKVLSANGDDVVVVDDGIDHRRLGSDFDGITVTGSPVDTDVLEKAGIRSAQLFVAATADDSRNVMAVQIAKEIFHVPTVLARVSDPDRERFYRGLGLNTVCPTTTGINQILGLLQKSIFSALSGTIDPDLVGVRPPEDWVGKTAADIAPPEGRVLAGVAKGEQVSPVNPGQVIAAGDTLILIRTRSR